MPVTPRATGCRWPAEWERHAATWIAWPHNLRTWPGHFDSIPERFATIIQTLAAYEPVHVLAGGDEVLSQARAMVGHLPAVVLHDIPTNDAWVRDYGPTFLCGPAPGEVSLVDWEYNAWGGKYPPWELDNQVPSRLARQLALRRFAVGVVLEGGSIDGNGQGVVLTTESCLLDPRRNAGMDRAQMEQILREYLCATEVVWLPGGPMAGDDTDGHVDQLARFIDPQRVVVAVADDRRDENYLPLQANVVCLEQRNRTGRAAPLEIIPLPLPQPISIDGQRVPASYCNFYIGNGCVLMPAFDDPADDAARELLQTLFVDREVIPLAARDLIWGLGALHCMTQQQPAA
ncbi:MAG: agmatine deiminase family protein [Pirellulaceae bacterium]|nr:agmatine deiminase family protein [Pirellulaceae bacterium]